MTQSQINALFCISSQITFSTSIGNLIGFLDKFVMLLLTLLHNQYFAGNNIGGFTPVTKGCACEWITSKAECEEAVKKLYPSKGKSKIGHQLTFPSICCYF